MWAPAVYETLAKYAEASKDKSAVSSSLGRAESLALELKYGINNYNTR